jgi:hypothetical protein
MIDDVRVHQADVSLLPSPSEIQDPIGYPDGDAGGGFVVVPNLPGERLLSVLIGGGYSTTYFFRANGTTGWTYPGAPGGTIEYPNEWIIGAPVEVVDAAQFEIMFHSVSALGFPNVSGDQTFTTPTMDTWLPGGVDYSFAGVIGPTEGAGRGIIHMLVNIKIRDVVTHIVLEEGQVDIVWDAPDPSGD